MHHDTLRIVVEGGKHGRHEIVQIGVDRPCPLDPGEVVIDGIAFHDHDEFDPLVELGEQFRGRPPGIGDRGRGIGEGFPVGETRLLDSAMVVDDDQPGSSLPGMQDEVLGGAPCAFACNIDGSFQSRAMRKAWTV